MAATEFVHRAEPRHQIMRIFVICRQQHGRARRRLWKRAIAIDGRPAITSSDQHEKSGQGRHEGKSDPREQQKEESEQHRFEHGHAADLHDLVHFVAARDRKQGRAGKDEQSAKQQRWSAAAQALASSSVTDRAGTAPSKVRSPEAETVDGGFRGSGDASSGRPSIGPHFGNRRIVLHQDRSQFDRRLALDRALEAHTPSARFGIWFGDNVGDLGFFRSHHSLDGFWINALELVAHQLQHKQFAVVAPAADSGPREARQRVGSSARPAPNAGDR